MGDGSAVMGLGIRVGSAVENKGVGGWIWVLKIFRFFFSLSE